MDPFRNYDAWLERPIQEMYAREEEAGQRAEAILSLAKCPWCDAGLEHDEMDPENLCAACGRTLLNEDSDEDAAERAAEARAEMAAEDAAERGGREEWF